MLNGEYEEYREHEPLLAEGELLVSERSRSFKRRTAVIFTTVLLGLFFCAAIVVPLAQKNHHVMNENSGPDYIVQAQDDLVLEYGPDESSNIAASQCKTPTLPNHNMQAFTGTWYEIAKIHSPQSEIFQEGCHCTTLEFSLTSNMQDIKANGTAYMSCNDERVNGERLGSEAHIQATQEPGIYVQSLFTETINWYLVIQKEQHALTYECMVGESGILEYGIHVLSRKAESDWNIIDHLLTAANDLGLNPREFELQMVDHHSDFCNVHKIVD